MDKYIILLTSGKLNRYLADIDRQAEEMFPEFVLFSSQYLIYQEGVL